MNKRDSLYPLGKTHRRRDKEEVGEERTAQIPHTRTCSYVSFSLFVFCFFVFICLVAPFLFLPVSTSTSS